MGTPLLSFFLPPALAFSPILFPRILLYEQEEEEDDIPMVAENFANFATTTLVSPNPLTSGGASFTVSTGQGALFPLSDFYVTIDSEILLITARTGIAGDTFSIAARGQDGTAAASHAAGATVQLCWLNANVTHLWCNVADTYNPQVPYAQNSSVGTQGADNEFEGASAAWTLSTPAGGTLFNAGSSQPSHLLLNRAAGDTAHYCAYEDISGVFTGHFIATCRVSQAFSLVGASANSAAHVELFLSDSSNPAAGPDTGNRVKVGYTLTPLVSLGAIVGGSAAASFITDASGVPSTIGGPFPLPVGIPLSLRIACDGSGVYTGYVGDGYTYWTLGTIVTGFMPNTLGLSFSLTSSSGPVSLSQTAAVDFVRVVGMSSAFLPTFGNVS